MGSTPVECTTFKVEIPVNQHLRDLIFGNKEISNYDELGPRARLFQCRRFFCRSCKRSFVETMPVILPGRKQCRTLARTFFYTHHHEGISSASNNAIVIRRLPPYVRKKEILLARPLTTPCASASKNRAKGIHFIGIALNSAGFKAASASGGSFVIDLKHHWSYQRTK